MPPQWLEEVAMQIDIRPPTRNDASQLFDWQLDVERLEREARGARLAGTPDPWTRIEAECSLDLIEAELTALRGREQAEAGDSVVQLRSWKARIERVLRLLEATDGP
jgi:hypothetical protein